MTLQGMAEQANNVALITTSPISLSLRCEIVLPALETYAVNTDLRTRKTHSSALLCQLQCS